MYRNLIILHVRWHRTTSTKYPRPTNDQFSSVQANFILGLAKLHATITHDLIPPVRPGVLQRLLPPMTKLLKLHLGKSCIRSFVDLSRVSVSCFSQRSPVSDETILRFNRC